MSSKIIQVETAANEGDLRTLKGLLGETPNQEEIDSAFTGAMAEAKIDVLKYLLSIGGNFSAWDYQGLYYATYSTDTTGLEFAITNGVDINVRSGMLLNSSIVTALNEKDNSMVKWILENGGDANLISDQSKMLLKRYGGEELKQLFDI